MNQKTFILIGRSGCGKGTQGKRLMEELQKSDPSRKTLYLAGGAEFRKFISGDTVTQKISKDIQDKGDLQPDFLAVYMWVNFLVQNFTGNEHLIIDGMPRKYHEAGIFESVWDFYKIERPMVIHLEVSKAWSVERLFARGRGDDHKEEIEHRQAWYETEVVPTMEYFKNDSSYTFIEVNGERPIQEVWSDVKGKLGL